MNKGSQPENGQTGKQALFASVPVPKALMTMAIPTIISQVINLLYNMVDTFYIGRTGNSYMMAATTVTLTLVMLNVALSGLFGIGGGSTVARLMGAQRPDKARQVSAFCLYGSAAVALVISLLLGAFLNPVLSFLGASSATLSYARSYALIVMVIGGMPSLVSLTLAHLLRNAGYSREASLGLSGGGILNLILDPLFMFVLLPRGQEVTGAALATTISNTCACLYLLWVFRRRAGEGAPLSLSLRTARSIRASLVRDVLNVGVPSAVLTGLFDVANICLNILAAAHSDLVLAGIGIVLKVERLPNAVNLGICQGMLPIVAFNYASGNHVRMRETIRTARLAGLAISATCILLFEAFAPAVCRVFLSTTAGNAETALRTVAYATLFLRIRALASPMQFLNYNTSYCMQAMGMGKATMLHAIVREMVFYIPFMIVFDRIFGEIGLVAALPVGETCGALFALFLLFRALGVMNRKEEPQ